MLSGISKYLTVDASSNWVLEHDAPMLLAAVISFAMQVSGNASLTVVVGSVILPTLTGAWKYSDIGVCCDTTLAVSLFVYDHNISSFNDNCMDLLKLDAVRKISI